MPESFQIARFDVPGPYHLPMVESDATGQPLLKRDDFGADLIYFPPGGAVPEHTHPGDHILFVLAGRGRVIYDGTAHDLSAGLAYLVPGSVPHAVAAGADESLTLLVVGNQHRAVDAAERLVLTRARD
jgi:quercetin dioxygenase-like cupin family protein